MEVFLANTIKSHDQNQTRIKRRPKEVDLDT